MEYYIWSVMCNQGLYYLQAGDEAVMELLLKSNIDVNDTDAEGNAALHFALKASAMGSCQHVQQNRSCSLCLACVFIGTQDCCLFDLKLPSCLQDSGAPPETWCPCEPKK